MPDASATKKKEVEKEKAPPKPPSKKERDALAVAAVDTNVLLLKRANAMWDVRFVSRVTRKLNDVRVKLNATVLRTVIATHVQNDETLVKALNGYVDQGEPHEPVVPSDAEMEESEDTTEKSSEKSESAEPADVTMDTSDEAEQSSGARREINAYIHLLTLTYLLDVQQYEPASVCAETLVSGISEDHYRRMMSPIAANAFFYYSRVFELTNNLASIRPTLLASYRTATLHHDTEMQAMLLNLLLRNYLHYDLYEQADKLLSKTHLDESQVSNNMFVRYLYYQGKIKAMQLEYSDAYMCLIQAIRKGPQMSARGFRTAVNKLAIIVQLLMGEIPERADFRKTGIAGQLKPYFELTKAVRLGDVEKFNAVVKKYEDGFTHDKTLSLIQRVHYNVIKLGLRKLTLSYSCIALSDVAQKLSLDADSVEYIVLKAIHDGVIEASVNHEKGFMQSKETGDIYSTTQPNRAFHKRTAFCLTVYNDAVKAMRFPPDAYKRKADKEELAERAKSEKELAKALEEEDDEDEEDML